MRGAETLAGWPDGAAQVRRMGEEEALVGLQTAEQGGRSTTAGRGRPAGIRGRERATLTAAMAVVAVLYVLHALALSQAQGFKVIDDAYITFRYIDHWLAGQGLVFNPGERVEGYSNFLWLVLLTPFRALGFDPVRISQALGFLFGGLTLLLTQRLTERFTGAAWLGVAAAALLAADGSFARWAIDGLETHLFTFLVTAAVSLEVAEKHHGRGRPWISWVGVVLGLAALARPEGALMLGLFTAYRLLAALRASLGWGTEPGPVGKTLEDHALSLGNRDFWREMAALWCYFALLVIPHLLWRRSYYGDWLPNTAYIKLAPGLVSTVRGLQYTVRFLGERWGLVAGVLFAVAAGAKDRAGRVPRSTWPLRFPLGLAMGVTLYVIAVGGDWMMHARFFMPVAPLLALMAVESVARGFGGGQVGVGYPVDRRAAALIAFMAIAGWFGSSWLAEWPRLRQAGLEHRGREAVIDWLGSHAAPGATLLTEEIGEIPYFTGMKTYDVYGLIDPHIARYGDFEPDAPAGHQRSDLNYSLSLEPDFLVLAEFRETWLRNIAPGQKKVRYPAMRYYQWIPIESPEDRLEIYRRRPGAPHRAPASAARPSGRKAAAGEGRADSVSPESEGGGSGGPAAAP